MWAPLTLARPPGSVSLVLASEPRALALGIHRPGEPGVLSVPGSSTGAQGLDYHDSSFCGVRGTLQFPQPLPADMHPAELQKS